MTTTGKFGEWHRIGNAGQLKNGERMHVRIEGRYITVFKHGGKLSALDSICYHAGGPLTLGPLKDIEDLNATFVACPWHRYLVNIDGGQRAYQAINFDNKTGKPVVQGWTMGKVVQRPHLVEERNGEIYLAMSMEDELMPSDKDACNAHCAQDYVIDCDIPGPSK